MATIFTEIVAGRTPCFKILEDDEFLAFLSETPMRGGHSLVIPKNEVDAIFEMDEGALSRMMLFAKRAAQLIQSAVPCVKIGLMAAGIQVRHAHLHLVPIDQPSDLDFSKQKPAAVEDLKKMADAILKKNFSR
ncbi:MAG: HIT family protein [Candidatus Omnitrophica bacterium]|jgi:histidine triad (HIT) family protein|nr:HIT family protein [Candidatus Omnitrophota bacterium]